jgi:hypothetical protein
MRVRITRPVPVRLELQPGDEIVVQHMTPGLEALLNSRLVGGEKNAELVDGDGDEKAVVPPAGETTTTGGGRRAPRTAPVSS